MSATVRHLFTEVVVPVTDILFGCFMFLNLLFLLW
jgi:hypothetical protein